METKRIVRVHEYRHMSGDKQTCICATGVNNVITLWDEIPRSEVVRLKTQEVYHERTESVQG